MSKIGILKNYNNLYKQKICEKEDEIENLKLNTKCIRYTDLQNEFNNIRRELFFVKQSNDEANNTIKE